MTADSVPGHVVITGGAGGIGRAMARLFLAEGARVSLLDRSGARLAEAVASMVAPERVAGFEADVADEGSVAEAVAGARKRFGAVDVQVNNAGVVLRGVPVAEIAPETWQWILGVNFFGAVNMVRAVLPEMQARGRGHIVNMASISGFVVGTRRSGAYAASKFALTAYTEALAADLDGSGIGVSLIAPAGVATRLYDHSAASRAGPPVPGAMDETPPDIAAAMDADQVAARVLDAIRNRRLFNMTHPETRAWIEERHAAVLGGFEGLSKLQEPKR